MLKDKKIKLQNFMHSTNPFLQISCKKKNYSISKGTRKKNTEEQTPNCS